MEVDKAKAFRLPDGSYIKMETSEGDVNASKRRERSWRTLDVSLVRPSGIEEVLCCFDYEGRKGLRVLVYDEEHEEPVFERLVRSGEATEGRTLEDNCKNCTYDCDTCSKNGDCSTQGMDGKPKWMEDGDDEYIPQF